MSEKNEQVELMAVDIKELRKMWSRKPDGYALRRQKVAELVKTGMTAAEVEREMQRRFGISIKHNDIDKMVAERNAKRHAGQFKPGQSGNPGGRPKNPQPTNAEVMALMQQVLQAINEGKAK